VVDVLPNGMLVVQATRQLTFSQQTQLIKLRGLVRPEDVSAQNQVQSTAMTDLELEVPARALSTTPLIGRTRWCAGWNGLDFLEAGVREQGTEVS
jgi:hypothetical protein